MDKHDRFIAINQTLPGLEDFLRVVLGSEPLSEDANRQRIEFIRRLENVSRPPLLPPRPANLSELYRTRVQQQSEASHSGSHTEDESNLYKNDRTLDPVEFASQQRELSRVANLYKTYAPQTVILGEKGSKNGGLYFPRDNIRDSIQSSSSAEDDIYERLSLKGVSPPGPVTPCDGETNTKNEESFMFPSPPKTPLEHTGTGIYVGGRPGSFRASAGKGKLSTGWFKKEAKVYEEVYVSNLREPVIKGYLRDIKANKRRWCVLQGNRLHIFKTQEDPAIMIIELLGCDIGVDDKKKISYSFRLTPKEGPGVSLAIEDGQDLSPWMSAIMAAVVRRGSIDRPNSPLDGAQTLEQARAERTCSTEVDGDKEKTHEELENFYELPVDNDTSRAPVAHSTPAPLESDDEEDEGYNPPLPPIPIIDDYSSSESSSDEDESMDKKEASEKAVAKKKVFDEIPADLLAELTAVKRSVAINTNKSQDSICEDGSANDQSMEFTDSHSEHSGNISNRHSYSEPLASDDTGSSEPKEEKRDSLSRKRTSTFLSVSMDSICSDTEETRSRSLTSESSLTSKGAGPKVKRRRKLVPAEAELQFLQDPAAMHSGILYQKRRLGVWSKRYCKIIDSRFKCYRNPADQKPSLDFPILGYDINLMDSKDSKKSYCIKISHPSQEPHFFATDSRVSIERWIEVLSLAATGRLDVIAPYPPYFCAEPSGDELKSRSQESLLSSEGRLSDDDSADTLDDLDAPSERDTSLKRLQTREEQSSFQADKSSMTTSNNASLLQSGTGDSGVQQAAEREVKERIHKKRKEKPSDKEGTKTPSTMSPPHSMFISESVDGQAKPEPMDQEATARAQGTTKESTEDSLSKKERRWTETLKKRRVTRGQSYDYRLRGNTATPIPPENAKNKLQSVRRKNSQTFANLLTLFDKEGRFCGNLTEVKYSKFSTTHLRRWCVVKNGVLILFNSESEETPQDKLSLVDMWLTDKSDESRNKFAFSLADKEGKETILQTTVKEDYQKWMGVLELFTELRVERPTPDVPDPPGKADSYASDLGEGNFERGTLRSKSARAATKLKDEIYALAPGKVRSSLRMKLSQKVNVRDIFRKTHSSYDLEGAPNEGPSSALPDTEVDTLAVFGGLLTQVEPNATAVDSGKSRWCTIKDKELLVFSERKATDPLRKIPLVGSVFSNLSDKEGHVNRFQVRHGNENTVFEAWDKFDLNRWLRMLASVTEYRNSSDDERPKCVGRLTSPTFAKKKILHRRTRSEALQEEEGNKPASTAQCYSKTKERSSSSTDRLMSGYLQEMREAHGARTLLRRWCVATSEKFIVYDNQNSKRASFEWELSEMEVQDQSDLDAGTFGFCVVLGDEKLCFKVIDEDSARHWLSVLARYCHAVAANQPLVKPPSKGRSASREDRRRSASDNDLKNTRSAEKDANVLEVLSEGRASGRKLVRRATEDSTFFRRFSRSELFKTPWRASSEKLQVKMRERPGRSGANQAWKRFSCGSLFDSEGKYSGYLMELITSELYTSQVRRWCLQRDDYLHVYENEACENPMKVIPLFDAKVIDASNFEACVYRFRIDYGDNKSVFFRALTRTDLEKWTTVISVKTAVLQDRSERRLRRSRTLSSEKNTDDLTGSSESDVASPDVFPAKHLTVDSTSLQSPVSICSRDSVFIRSTSGEEETSFIDSAGLKAAEKRDEYGSSAVESKNEQSTNQEQDNTGERTLSHSHSDTSNVKRVNRLSSIEDLSHIYENFLAFASAMAERSPEFQEQLYHVYENVTQAFDTRSSDSVHEEGEQQLIKEFLVASSDQETVMENEVGSPSVEINSEFEKISLREKEDRYSTYRYSGICGESELEKLEEVDSQTERSVINTLAEDENENNPTVDLLSDSFAGETSSAAITDQSTLEGELLKVTSDNDEDAMDNLMVGVTLDGVIRAEADSSCEKYREIEEAGVVENYLEDSDEDSQVQTSQLESDQDSNGAVTDVVETSSQTPLQDEGTQEDQLGVGVAAVGVTPTLVHADHVSTVETRASSFYLVQEVNDQVWREIDSDEPREPVVKTSVQISTTAESASDRKFSALVGVQSVADENDEGTAGGVEYQDPVVEGKHGSIPSDSDVVTKHDSSKVDEPSFTAEQATSVVNTDVRVYRERDEQFGLSRTEDMKNQAASSETQDLGEDNTFSGDAQDSNQVEKSSSSSLSCVCDDVQEGNDKQKLQVGKANLTSRSYCRSFGVVQSVCAAESFETSVPLVSTCSRESEVRCEQTILSAVSESEQAQLREEALMSVGEEAVQSPQNVVRETATLQASPSLEFENKDCAAVGDNANTLSSEICNTNERTGNDQAILRDKSNELDGQHSNPETEVLNTATNAYPEECCADAVKTQSSDTTSFSLYKTSEEDCTECSTTRPSDQDSFSADGTTESLQENSNLVEGHFNESKSAESAPKHNSGLNCGTSEGGSAKAVHIFPSESDNDTAPAQKAYVPNTEPIGSDSDSKNLLSVSHDTWRDSSNLDDNQSMSRSQMDILKAVTAAFEEILELHGDDSDADDTKL